MNMRILPRSAIPTLTCGYRKGTSMTGEKGNKLARVIPEESLGDKLESEPRLDKMSQKRIGDQLRAMYDELMQQPVPDRFKDLLAQLDKGSEEKKK